MKVPKAMMEREQGQKFVFLLFFFLQLIADVGI